MCNLNKVLIAWFVKGSASYFRLVLFVVTHFVLKFTQEQVIILKYSDFCWTDRQTKGGISTAATRAMEVETDFTVDI